MAKIVVEVGVYLPSNPDGKVIDVDRKSGRPLQSHAKVNYVNRCMYRVSVFSGSVHGHLQSS